MRREHTYAEDRLKRIEELKLTVEDLVIYKGLNYEVEKIHDDGYIKIVRVPNPNGKRGTVVSPFDVELGHK